jgi:predicted transcriptional regulator
MDAIPDFKRGVLVSIRPFYAAKILDGHKTVELRRKFPEVGAIGGMALIYSSSPVSAIVGCARIKRVLKLPVSRIWKEYGTVACISKGEFDAYFTGLRCGFVIFFEGVQPLKKQLKAIDLVAQFGIVPPQSYRYVTNECVALLSNDGFQASHRHKRRHRAGRRSAGSSVSR